MLKTKSVLILLAMELLLAALNARADCSFITSAIENYECIENSQNSTINTTMIALQSSYNHNTIINRGVLNLQAGAYYGIQSSGISALNINYGEIIGSGSGISSWGQSSLNVNYGIISLGDPSSLISYVAISNIDNYTTTHFNYGTIEVSGWQGGGISAEGLGTVASNYGSIRVVGRGTGISNSGDLGETNNFGSIFVQELALSNYPVNGNVSNGIFISGNSPIFNNTGSVIVNGPNARAIWIGSTNGTFFNSGKIIARGDSSAAIVVWSDNNTFVLKKGSVIVNDIFVANGNTGNKLNVNLGAAASFAYSVTGDWTIADLDKRPMVTMTDLDPSIDKRYAYAAGIGAQETASEMLYQRTSAITSALDRRLRSYASDEVDNQPYWLDVYYSDVTRNSGGNYSTQTAFSNYNYGITAGFKLPNEVTPMELVVNVAQSNLNIDGGNQKVDSTGLMVGVLAPDLTDLLGAKLSAKALIGYANHDGDRKVMTNSLLYDGSRQIKSDYNSVYGVVGAALTKLYPITDRLTADVVLGLDLNTQRFESYKESDYFAWDSRTLTQLQSRIQTGLDYRFNENKASVFARVGAENRNLIGGVTQDYAINGMNVSFNSNNKNDTYLTAQVGIKAQIEKRIQLFGLVNTLRSSDSVNTVLGNFGVRADF